jgi:hypothetical protein
VFDDLIGQFDAHRVFDQVEDGLAATGVPADVDVRFQIRNDVRISILGLKVDRFEELSKSLLEALLDEGFSVCDAS